MLYNTEDYLEIKKARNKILLQLIVASLIFLAIIAVCSIFRVSWAGYTAAAVWGIYVVFIWGMKGSRIRKYYHFLKDINEGLENNIVGTVEDIDTSLTTKDMIDFYTIIIREDDAEPDSPARRIYLDASKGLPKYEVGARIAVNLFGNYIKALEIL
jgi:hypothetical protein